MAETFKLKHIETDYGKDKYSASPPIRDPESLISSLEFWVRIRDSKLANLEIPYFGRPKSQERPDDVIIFRVC